MIPTTPDHVPDWLADGAWCSSAPDDAPPAMPDLWPEDMLSEAGWEAGWFDRQVAGGRLELDQRVAYPPCFGGTKGVAS